MYPNHVSLFLSFLRYPIEIKLELHQLEDDDLYLFARYRLVYTDFILHCPIRLNLVFGYFGQSHLMATHTPRDFEKDRCPWKSHVASWYIPATFLDYLYVSGHQFPQISNQNAAQFSNWCSLNATSTLCVDWRISKYYYEVIYNWMFRTLIWSNSNWFIGSSTMVQH